MLKTVYFVELAKKTVLVYAKNTSHGTRKTDMVTENRRLSVLQTGGFRQRTLCNLMSDLKEVTYLETVRENEYE